MFPTCRCACSSTVALQTSPPRRRSTVSAPSSSTGFGPLPVEVDHLLKIVYIKGLCRRANVEKIDAGPKGVVISFRNGEFANPGGLVGYITEQGVLAKIRPDQKVVLSRDWPDAEQRLKGAASVLMKLVRLAEAGEKAA